MNEQPPTLPEAERQLLVAMAEAIQAMSPIVSQLMERGELYSPSRQELDDQFGDAMGKLNQSLSWLRHMLKRSSSTKNSD